VFFSQAIAVRVGRLVRYGAGLKPRRRGAKPQYTFRKAKIKVRVLDSRLLPQTQFFNLLDSRNLSQFLASFRASALRRAEMR
jgi:hypothetical protein